jgi:hypothetical protein
MQEEVDELKSDCVIRKCRLDEKKMQRIGEEAKKLQEDIIEFSDFVVQVKPSWKAIWEKELQGIVKEQTFLKEEEGHSAEIEDEYDAMMTVYETLEKLMELQSKNDVIVPLSLQVASAEEVQEEGMGGVLTELQMTVRDDDTNKRISAIQRIEQKRLKKVQQDKEEGNEFTNELRLFVGNGKLKATGGIAEVERRRKKQDEGNLEKIAAFLQ